MKFNFNALAGQSKLGVGVAALFLMLSGCGGSVAGSGEPAEQEIDIAQIRELSVSSAGSVRITIGEQESVKISGDDNILEIIEVNRTGDKLVIAPVLPDVFLKPEVPLEYNIQLRALEVLSLSGEMTVEVTGLYTDAFSLASTGVLDIYMEGQVQDMQLIQAGVSRLDAKNLTAETLNLDLTGSTEVDISVTGAIHGRLAGLSKLTYHGGPVLDVQAVDQATASIGQLAVANN